MQNRVLSLITSHRKPHCIRPFSPFHNPGPVAMPSGRVLALFAFVQKHDFIQRSKHPEHWNVSICNYFTKKLF